MQNKINEILNKIREANPELMKLEKNCKFIFKLAKENLLTKDGLYEITEIRLPMIYVISEEDGEHHDGFFTIDNFEDNPDEYEILGKDPTLSNLLNTIKKEYQEPNLSFVNLAGVEEILNMYNFELSFIQNLENEELVEFVHNIICKEE